MKSQAGFVLVNALIIVAAMAGAAVFLLARAEGGRARLEASQSAGQLTYYLDAFDALAITVLNADLNLGDFDHTNEAWANSDIAVPLDRGKVAGSIADQQALFNLNWLNDTTHDAAQSAFDALLVRRGVSPSMGDQIRDFIQPAGPENKRRFAAETPALAPVGGALLLFDQIADIPGIRTQDLNRLRSATTALPAGLPININTASYDLLVSLMPEIPGAALNQILRERERAPFQSIDSFVEAIESRLGEEMPEEFPLGRLTVASEWFLVDAQAEMGGQRARRTTMLYRLGRQTGTLVRWQISRFD